MFLLVGEGFATRTFFNFWPLPLAYQLQNKTLNPKCSDSQTFSYTQQLTTHSPAPRH
jgi:hypothetical protein